MGAHDPDAAAAGELTRRARRGHDVDARPDAPDAGASALSDDDADERTVVILRDDADERTVVVDRRPGLGAQALRAGSEASDPDPAAADTIVVRSRPASTEDDPSTADTIAAPPRRRPGDAAPAIYKPRPAPVAPSRPPAVVGATAPTRDTDAVLASVVRRDRRSSAIAVTAVGVACVVSMAGLVGLVVALLS